MNAPFANWMFRLFETANRQKRARTARPLRPKPLTCEQLEDRVVPATDFWTGAGGNGLWNTGANWLSGTAPVNGDTLVFETNLTTVAMSPTPAAATAYTTTDILRAVQNEGRQRLGNVV